MTTTSSCFQLKEVCEQHIRRQVHDFDDDVSGETFLRRLDQHWKEHCQQTVRNFKFC